MAGREERESEREEEQSDCRIDERWENLSLKKIKSGNCPQTFALAM